MEEYAHKSEIIQTRAGGLGGSDAPLLAKIASLGYVPKTAYKRMAVCKGLIPSEDHGTNAAMRYGDYIENQIFQHLTQGDSSYQSNPMLVSEKYSTPNCLLFAHPDYLKVDEGKQTLYVYECKATRYNVQETKINYRTQLYVEWLLAKEVAAKKGVKWKVKLFLVHYSTDGVNVEECPEFDPNRLSVHEVRFISQVFDVAKGMKIVNDFLETFEFYTEEEEINSAYLPEKVQSQFNQIATFLHEIKEREAKVEEFKARLYDFMQDKGIKRIACDDFSFTLVAPSESSSVDYKKIFEKEFESRHPRKANKLKDQNKKVVKKKGYVLIKTSNNN